MTGSETAPPGVFRVALEGEIDLQRKPELSALVEAFQASSASSARVDLGAVTFMDSTCLTMLAQLRQIALDRGGSVTLAHPSVACLRLLDLVAFHTVFQIEP